MSDGINHGQRITYCLTCQFPVGVCKCHEKPEWAQWQPDIFQQTLPGMPYMMPQEALPSRDCANCLFHQEGWRDGGFCYMFRIEPSGDKCGQFKTA
jgi:hypothetical protein